MQPSEGSEIISSAERVEHTEAANPSVSPHSGLDDAWDEKAKAQRKWAAKSDNQFAFAHNLSPTAGRSSRPALDMADLQNNSTEEALVKEVDTPPSATARKDQAMPESMPARRSGDEVLEVLESPPDPIATTHEPESPPVNFQDHNSLPDLKDHIHDDQKEKFSLSSRNQRQDMYSYDTINIGGKADVLFGSAVNSARHEPPDTQQNFGNIQFKHGSHGIFGNVYNYHTPALFGELQALTSDATDDAAIEYRRSPFALIQVEECSVRCLSNCNEGL